MYNYSLNTITDNAVKVYIRSKINLDSRFALNQSNKTKFYVYSMSITPDGSLASLVKDLIDLYLNKNKDVLKRLNYVGVLADTEAVLASFKRKKIIKKASKK